MARKSEEKYHTDGPNHPCLGPSVGACGGTQARDGRPALVDDSGGNPPQPNTEVVAAAECIEQQRRRALESSVGSGSTEQSMEPAVLTGGTVVPGHHPRNSVRGLDRILGSPTNADRKRLCEHTAADGPADGVAMVVAGQVESTGPEATAKRQRTELRDAAVAPLPL